MKGKQINWVITHMCVQSNVQRAEINMLLKLLKNRMQDVGAYFLPYGSAFGLNNLLDDNLFIAGT